MNSKIFNTFDLIDLSRRKGATKDYGPLRNSNISTNSAVIQRVAVSLCTIFLAVIGLLSESRAANSSGECYITVNVAGETLPAGWSYQLQYYDTDSNWYNLASGSTTKTYYKQQGDWLNRSIQWRCQLKQNNINYGTAQTSTCFAGSDTVSFSVAAPVAAIPPTITSQPTSQSRSTGGSVTFSVAATGTAPLIYQWRKNGSNISNANTVSYTIASVTAGDAGNYSCFVSNTAGNATSQVATLTVNGTEPPVSPGILQRPTRPVSFPVNGTFQN